MGNSLSINHGLVQGVGAAALVLLFALRKWTRGRNPIQDIAGPPSCSWIYGNMLQLMLTKQYGDYEFDWQRSYGAVYRLKGCFSEDRLMVSDPVALQFILNSAKFEHSPMFASMMRLMHDRKSLIVAQGENHRRLRAALNPKFSAACVRGYEPVMQRAAQEVGAANIFVILNNRCSASQITRELEKSPTLAMDILPLLSNAALGVVSEALLGCSTQDLGDEFMRIMARAVSVKSFIFVTRLSLAYLMSFFRNRDLGLGVNETAILGNAIGTHLPEWVWDIAALLPTGILNELRQGKHTSIKIGRQIVERKMMAMREGLEVDADVYSRLLDGGHHSDKNLTPEELAAQTSLIIIAGHETTTNTLAFGLLELARNPIFQDSLRTEIHSTLTKGGSDVVYNNMPLLNAFIKEILRLYPILANEERIAVEDTVVPLAESIVTTTGARISHVPVRKGQVVSVAIASYQRLESLWGPDAGEFRPLRWVEGVNYRGEYGIGPYANLLTFFAGPRTCLGWRFAILEMQVLICELVGKFSFELPKGEDTPRMYGATVVASVLSSGERGVPLCIKRIV
ncbi:cytochrome P450 [Roridomyces roridus]|uniref:Cytochrome P450 n=1 Tax=Roridomyces roridus TaxID=1738132 RepID=A0AAD7C028_9AGAR|nr:cytochrome P450 [Roridomyces roridus]